MEEGTSIDTPVYVTELDIIHEKLIGKKWRHFIGAVHEETPLGRARLELYTTRKLFQLCQPHRVILLTECVSMRASTTDGRATIRIQLKDDTAVEITSNDPPELTTVLSKIAFPKSYVKIKSELLDSPSSEDELPLSQVYPVLLLPSTLTRYKKITEGNYSLEFGDSLFLKNGDMQIQQYPYSYFKWVAAGENCLGFEVEGIGMYEFICASPLSIVETFRSHIRFGCSFPALTVKTTNKYNRTYYPRATPLDTPGTSNHSTLESKVSESTSKSQLNDSSNQSDFSFGASLLDASISSVDSKQSKNDKEKKKSKIFSMFRRSTKKKDAGSRLAFEENADSEWLRVAEEKEKQVDKSDKSNRLSTVLPQDTADLFREELMRSIAENKVRREQRYETAEESTDKD